MCEARGLEAVGLTELHMYWPQRVCMGVFIDVMEKLNELLANPPKFNYSSSLGEKLP